MTAAVVGLIAAYGAIVVLLLSLNLKSCWHWSIKAGAIAIGISFLVVAFVALEGMLGWPTEARPPIAFELYGSRIDEPNQRDGAEGAIYLWLTPKNADDAPIGLPRAYALPYTRALHEQVAKAQGLMEQGRPVAGAVRPTSLLGSRSVQVELFAAPPTTLPPKQG